MPAELLNSLATDLTTIKDLALNPSSSRNERSLATELKRWKFALSLPLISSDILPDHARFCPQCRLAYNPNFEVAGSKAGHETAVVLPCGCVMGFHCARQWLSPHECGFTTCPGCHYAFPEMAGDTPDASKPTREEVLEEEEMAKQIADITIYPNGDEDEEWHLSSIDEVLMAHISSIEPKTSAMLKSPDITVTTPEGDTSADYEADMDKAISNAGAFGQDPWGAALAAIKAADLIARRSGS